MTQPTPRTDAFAHSMRNLPEGDPYAYREMTGHARQLETELAGCRLALAEKFDPDQPTAELAAHLRDLAQPLDTSRL
jgi:hypothetical protein